MVSYVIYIVKEKTIECLWQSMWFMVYVLYQWREHWVFLTVYWVHGLMCYTKEETTGCLWVDGVHGLICYIIGETIYDSIWGCWSRVLYHRRDHWVFLTVCGVHELMCYTIEETTGCLWQSIWFMVSCIIQKKRPLGIYGSLWIHGLMCWKKKRPLVVYESMGFMVSCAIP